jgi:hypothetical protein
MACPTLSGGAGGPPGSDAAAGAVDHGRGLGRAQLHPHLPLPIEVLRLVDTLRGNGQPTGGARALADGGQGPQRPATPPAAGGEAG